MIFSFVLVLKVWCSLACFNVTVQLRENWCTDHVGVVSKKLVATGFATWNVYVPSEFRTCSFVLTAVCSTGLTVHVWAFPHESAALGFRVLQQKTVTDPVQFVCCVTDREHFIAKKLCGTRFNRYHRLCSVAFIIFNMRRLERQKELCLWPRGRTNSSLLTFTTVLHAWYFSHSSLSA